MATVREALEVTIKSHPSLSNNANAAIVSLCRLLAEQIDDAGANASSRLTAAYLSALKDLNRAAGAAASTTPGGEPVKGADAGGALGKLQALQGGKSA